jgi:hypothetical protein
MLPGSPTPPIAPKAYEPMTFGLPAIAGTPCVSLTACGRLEDPVKRKVQPIMAARYRAEKGTHYLRLLQSGSPVSHVHIDIASKTYFGDTPPEMNSKRSEIEGAIARYYGYKAKVLFRAAYVLPRERLPAGSIVLVGEPNRVVTKVDDVEVELVGANMAIRGSAIEEIDWLVVKGGVLIDLAFEKVVEISERYILDLLRTANDGFTSLVLRKGN